MIILESIIMNFTLFVVTLVTVLGFPYVVFLQKEILIINKI
jgi:hypothetical protein